MPCGTALRTLRCYLYTASIKILSDCGQNSRIYKTEGKIIGEGLKNKTSSRGVK